MTQPRTNGEALADGQQVITACAFIHHKFDGVDKLFLPKRATTKRFLPGVFEIPGGHVEFGEDTVAALKREIREEFGMSINVGDVIGCFTYKNEVKRSHSIEVVYFATFADPIERIVLNPADHSEYTWVSQPELANVCASQADTNNAEWVVARRGFELLAGARPAFG
jgi:8-oxo-dGTP diphosphatase